MKALIMYAAAVSGVVSSMGCFQDRFEPNNEPSTATLIEPGTETDLGIDVLDQDWFQVVVADGHIGTVGIEYGYAGVLGDLNLYGYDAEFDAFERSWGPRSTAGLLGKEEEFLSVLSLSGDNDFYYVVSAASRAGNTYNLSVDLVPYADGSDCATEFDEDECLGLVDGETRLYQFPFPDPDDGFVGDGYAFDTYSNYLWARRETIMYIRHALHEVQQQFPGTNPVGIIDVSQRDGLTPGTDAGILRHPATTHDQGGNIDMAYFQTGADNRARIICDADGGSHDGAYCDESSVDTHIVDLPRTAYFLAKLACLPDCDNPRLRVVGVDRVIGPLLDEAVFELMDSGIISEEEYANAYYRIAYGDGWPYHHHHMHISFQWWDQTKTPEDSPPIGCGFMMPGDRPL